MAVTPVAGINTLVAVGGTAVAVLPGNITGGIIQNPYAPADQGLANAEPIYVDPTGADATLQGNGTTFRIEPGQTWAGIPGQTTVTKVNAATNGHKFSAVSF